MATECFASMWMQQTNVFSLVRLLEIRGSNLRTDGKRKQTNLSALCWPPQDINMSWIYAESHTIPPFLPRLSHPVGFSSSCYRERTGIGACSSYNTRAEISLLAERRKKIWRCVFQLCHWFVIQYIHPSTKSPCPFSAFRFAYALQISCLQIHITGSTLTTWSAAQQTWSATCILHCRRTGSHMTP